MNLKIGLTISNDRLMPARTCLPSMGPQSGYTYSVQQSGGSQANVADRRMHSGTGNFLNGNRGFEVRHTELSATPTLGGMMLLLLFVVVTGYKLQKTKHCGAFSQSGMLTKQYQIRLWSMVLSGNSCAQTLIVRTISHMEFFYRFGTYLMSLPSAKPQHG